MSGRNLIRKALIVALLAAGLPAMAQVFNCTAFTSSAGPCSVNFPGAGSLSFSMVGAFNGSQPFIGPNGSMVIDPVGAVHTGNGFVYQTAVNVQAFTSTFTFTPDGNNVTFTLENNTNANGGGGGNPLGFSGGAGCEAGIYQAFGTAPTSANNIFSVELDQFGFNNSAGVYNGSTAQLYQPFNPPCNPNDSGPNFWLTNKILTTNVNMNAASVTAGSIPGFSAPTAYSCSGGTCTITATNSFTSGQHISFSSPVGDGLAALTGTTQTVLSGGLSSSQFEITTGAVTGSGSTSATTGDIFSATVIYDGTNVTLNLFDATIGGTCSPTSSGTCFHNVWSAVDIPAMVDGNTAYPVLTEGNGNALVGPLPVYSWSYTVNSAPSTPSLSTYTTQSYMAGTTPAANPTFSPAAGSYSGSQSVTMSCTSGSSNICYSSIPTLGSTTILPQTDNHGGCQSGTPYSGAVTVSSTTTLYAQCGTNLLSLPSNLVSGTFTIGGGTQASAPTFSPVAGTYIGTQSVTISSTSSGAIKCYNTTGSPATNGTTGCAGGSTLYSTPVSVTSTETLYAVAGGTGFTDSPVGSAAYTINTTATPAITLASGSYAFPQTTTITDGTAGSAISYCTTTFLGSCSPGTSYTGAITISSTETICANAVFNSSTSSTVCNNYGTQSAGGIIIAKSTFDGRFKVQ